MTKRLTVTLVLLVLIGLGILWWKPEGVFPASASVRENRASVSQGGNWASGSSGAPSKLPRTLRDHRKLTIPTHAPAELKDFIIPSLELEDASLAEALSLLFDQYKEICAETGEVPLRFSYRIKGEPEARIDLQLRQVSFLQALSILAARTGLLLDRDGTELVFSHPTVPEVEEATLTASSRVPPDFAHQLHELLNPDSSRDPAAEKGPFVTSPPLPPPADLLKMLRQLGIIRSANADVSYLASSSTLVIRGSAADQARLKAFLEEQLTPPVMFKALTKFVDSPEPIDLPDGPLTDQQFQDLFRELNSMEGVSLATQPSVVSHPGQKATIEMIREVLTSDPEDSGEIHRDWVGNKIDIDTGGYGFDVQGALSIQSRATAAGRPNEIEGAEISSLQHVPEGSTFVVETTTPAGKPRYAFVTIHKLDPAGRRLPPRADPE